MTNGRLQHIKELVRLAAYDPHLDQTKLNDLLPLTINGVLAHVLQLVVLILVLLVIEHVLLLLVLVVLVSFSSYPPGTRH